MASLGDKRCKEVVLTCKDVRRLKEANSVV